MGLDFNVKSIVQLGDEGDDVERVQNAVGNQTGFGLEIHIGAQFFQNVH